MAYASGSSEEKGIYISSSAEDEEFKKKLVADLVAAQITIREPVIYKPREKKTEWLERKCKSARVFLVIMSGEYQVDEDCKDEADTAQRLMRNVIFTKAKNFTANAWMKNLTNEMLIFDLSTDSKYSKNIKNLIESVKDGTEITFLRELQSVLALSTFLRFLIKCFSYIPNQLEIYSD